MYSLPESGNTGSLPADPRREQLEAEINRLKQKLRTFCGGPEVEILRLQIEALERQLASL
jgi:hypothetical protein